MPSYLVGQLLGATLVAPIISAILATIARFIWRNISINRSYLVGSILSPLFCSILYNLGDSREFALTIESLVIYGFGAFLGRVDKVDSQIT